MTRGVLRDLPFRRRSLIAAIIAAGIAFSLSLVLFGIAGGLTDRLQPSAAAVANRSPQRPPVGAGLIADARTTVVILGISTGLLAVAGIAAIGSLSVRARADEFAMLNALGGEPRRISAALVVQAVFGSLAAATLAAVATLVLAPLLPVTVILGFWAYAALAATAVVAGLLAGTLALRGIRAVDPAVAFLR